MLEWRFTVIHVWSYLINILALSLLFCEKFPKIKQQSQHSHKAGSSVWGTMDKMLNVSKLPNIFLCSHKIWFVFMSCINLFTSSKMLRILETTVHFELGLPRCFGQCTQRSGCSFGPKSLTLVVNNGVLWGDSFSLHSASVCTTNPDVKNVQCTLETGTMSQRPAALWNENLRMTTASQLHAEVVPTSPNIAMEQKQKTMTKVTNMFSLFICLSQLLRWEKKEQ